MLAGGMWCWPHSSHTCPCTLQYSTASTSLSSSAGRHFSAYAHWLEGADHTAPALSSPSLHGHAWQLARLVQQHLYEWQPALVPLQQCCSRWWPWQRCHLGPRLAGQQMVGGQLLPAAAAEVPRGSQMAGQAEGTWMEECSMALEYVCGGEPWFCGRKSPSMPTHFISAQMLIYTKE